MRPLFRSYKVPHIANMQTFYEAVGYWLAAAVRDKRQATEMTSLQKQLEDANVRVTSATNKAEVLEADLVKQRTDVGRLTNELATANARVAELERQLCSSQAELRTVRQAAEVASTSVYGIQGVVNNLTRQLDDAVRNAVAEARQRVDLIRNPTAGAPQNDPAGARTTGGNPPAGGGRGGNPPGGGGGGGNPPS